MFSKQTNFLKSVNKIPPLSSKFRINASGHQIHIPTTRRSVHCSQRNGSKLAFRPCPRLLQPQDIVYGRLFLLLSFFGKASMKRLLPGIVLVLWSPSKLSLPPSPPSNLLRLRNTEKFWPRQTGHKFKQMFTLVGDKFDMYMNCLYDLARVVIRVTINKL